MATSRKWHQTLYTYIWVFNTGRGLSVCIRLPHNVGVLYDLGRSEAFSPAEFVSEHIAPSLTRYEKRRLAQCFLSHPHADHIAEIREIADDDDSRALLHPYLLTCPNDKAEGEEVNFGRVETDDNAEIIRAYRDAYEDRKPPLRTIGNSVPCSVPSVEYGFYYMAPPQVDAVHQDSDQLYCNGLSLVVYLRHGNQSVLVPGDITPDVLRSVLDCGASIERRYTYLGSTDSDDDDLHERTSTQPVLSSLLSERGLSVLVTPHHGLESGYCQELFDAIRGGKPGINVISEKRHLSTSDGQVDECYQSKHGAIGLDVDIDGEMDRRYSVSTRDGHHILLIFKGTDGKPHVYLRSKPEELLEIV